MKKKLVTWGSNAQDEKVLIAIQLLAEENKIKILTIPEKTATPEIFSDLMDKWRMDQEYTFPEDTRELIRELSVSEGLLPEDLKVDRTDLLLRAQAEWHFIVLSSKLHEAYASELEDLKEKVDRLTEYDSGMWENLKGFWGKVQSQVQEKNLFWDHANTLRDGTNELFSKLKELRAVLDEEFRNQSKTFKIEFLGLIEEVQTKLNNNANLNRLFDDLKNIQKKYKDTKFTKDDRNKVWSKLDEAFKAVKEKKFGPETNPGNSPEDRLRRRLKGLENAIEKMERSIKRDDDEIKFQTRRMDKTEGQLELQIRQAKLKMLEERIKSKRLKHEDMLKTKEELNIKIAKFPKKEAKDESEAKETNKSDDANQAKTQTEDTSKSPPKEKISDALGATIGEALGDVADTAKAIAGVVSEKVTDAISDFTEELKEKHKARREEEE